MKIFNSQKEQLLNLTFNYYIYLYINRYNIPGQYMKKLPQIYGTASKHEEKAVNTKTNVLMNDVNLISNISILQYEYNLKESTNLYKT